MSANSVAVSTVMATQIAAVSSGLVFYVSSKVYHRKPSVLALLNGLIAGMAGVTPASGYVDVTGAFVIGVVLGMTFWAAVFLKRVLRIDDALDVSIVHGLTGVIGSLAIGFLATSDINPDSADGLFYGGDASFVGWQLLAVLLAGAWSSAWTFIILYVVNRWVWNVRVRLDDERTGLDVVYHGEFAYHNLRLKGAEPLFEALMNELDESESSSESVDAPHERQPLLAVSKEKEEADKRLLLASRIKATKRQSINDSDSV